MVNTQDTSRTEHNHVEKIAKQQFYWNPLQLHSSKPGTEEGAMDQLRRRQLLHGESLRKTDTKGGTE